LDFQIHEDNNGIKFEFKPSTCTVCGSDCPKLVGWRGGAAHHGGRGVRTKIVRCCQCSHMYPNPMPFPVEGLDSLYSETEEYFVGHDIERKQGMGRDILLRLETALGRRGRFLDIGCGRGEFLWAAREAGWEYEGIDASSTFIEWGRQHLGIESRHVVLEDAGYPEDHFDAITMGGLLEHLYHPNQTMREVRRILRPGGLLWFDAPNESGLYMRAGNLYMKCLGRDWCVNLAPTFPPYHVQGFNPASLRALLAQVGFDIVKLKVEGGLWPFTGEPSLRKHLEYRAAQIVTWIGNKTGTGSYMEAVVRKPLRVTG
jgi:2-polyprenyl-3-methyl-5-hydroxy-6-metoxy-1,4-benzoquinol methylase